MPKPGKRTTADIINADEDPDGVDAALGIGDQGDDEVEPDDDEQTDESDEDDEDEEDDDDDEDPLEALRAELREQKRTIARLTREAAAARVAGKAKSSSAGGNTSEGGEVGETVEQALERGKEEARLEFGLERAGDRIRAALTGIIPESDLDDFVNDLRLERYVDEDGKPDADAIKALRDRQAKITRRRGATRAAGHGRQTGTDRKKSKSELMGDTMTSLGL